MFDRLTLRQKIFTGTIVLMVLMMVVGMAGYFGLSSVLTSMGFYQEVNNLQKQSYMVKSLTDTYFVATYNGDTETQQKNIQTTISTIRKEKSDINKLLNQLSPDGDVYHLLGKVKKYVELIEKNLGKYFPIDKQNVDLEKEIKSGLPNIEKLIKKGQLLTEGMQISFGNFKGEIFNYSKTPSEDNWSELVEMHGSFKKHIGEWQKIVEDSKTLAPLAIQINKKLEIVNNTLQDYHTNLNSQKTIRDDIIKQNNTLNDYYKTLNDITIQDLNKKVEMVIRFIFSVLGVSLIIGIIYALFSTRKIISKIKIVIDSLDESADQVGLASEQISSDSHLLAESASEQAASIEETSASLEEMSSMTKLNADNANHADKLMRTANQIVDDANTSMKSLTASMGEIFKASEETSKIIKTIDEIAFQTNLLALNAAVEAARAGEAGAGFAVVADEVRNLAMRAADAAKNTAGLIEETVKQVKDGSELVIHTNETFAKVSDSTKKVGDLVSEIDAASKEQAQGIDQINQAVAGMDKITQQNAARAEESASASEEMNAQSVQLKSMVVNLIEVVGREKMKKNAGSAKPDSPMCCGPETIFASLDNPENSVGSSTRGDTSIP